LYEWVCQGVKCKGRFAVLRSGGVLYEPLSNQQIGKLWYYHNVVLQAFTAYFTSGSLKMFSGNLIKHFINAIFIC